MVSCSISRFALVVLCGLPWLTAACWESGTIYGGEDELGEETPNQPPTGARSEPSTGARSEPSTGFSGNPSTLGPGQLTVDAGGAGVGEAVSTEQTVTSANPEGAVELGTVEDSGRDCAVPELPSATRLTAYAKHHDPFLMLDGSRITLKSEWRCRRAEIKAQVEEYESGPKPSVKREDVRAAFSNGTLTVTVSEAGKSVTFSVRISRPSGAGAAAIPGLIAYGFNSLDRGVFDQKGVATITFNNDALGAQRGGASRGTGVFYDLYGRDHPASSMVAWAWGVSRVLDALEQTPEAGIDPARVAVTGCSRNGKGALLAGAFDERIVLTIPQESGAGGSSSWRVAQTQSERGENVQTLSSAAGEQPWFRASFGPTFGGRNVTKLPFDHHMLMGLVAPRALLVIDNRIDWLGIDATYTAGSVAHAIWEAFGLSDHMGYWQTGGHAHCQFPAEQRGILEAYVRRFLASSGTGDTEVLRAQNAQADLAAWMEWTPPDLQ